jgi:hypothetical protein
MRLRAPANDGGPSAGGLACLECEGFMAITGEVTPEGARTDRLEG